MFSSPRTDGRIAFALFSVAVGFAIPAQAAQATPKCCVWRVTNAKAPFYLVGSVHALTKDDYPLPSPYEIALKDAKRFLFEFDPTRQAEFEKKLNAVAKYPPTVNGDPRLWLGHPDGRTHAVYGLGFSKDSQRVAAIYVMLNPDKMRVPRARARMRGIEINEC